MFEIAKNTTFKLFDVGKTGILHDDTSLFTANASSTEHDDFFVLQAVFKLRNRLRKRTEGVDVEFNRIVKRS